MRRHQPRRRRRGDARRPATQDAPPDRSFDEVEGRRRRDERGSEPGRKQRAAVETSALLADQDIERPVPQVQAVRDLTDPSQRPDGQERAEQTWHRAGHACDHDRDEHRAQRETAPVEPACTLGRVRPDPSEPHRASSAPPWSGRVAFVPSGRRRRLARRPQNADSAIRPSSRHSASSRLVIRKPLRTKKASTPRYPPPAHETSPWYSRTAPTANARSPSSAGM
jgi:hypothetical protein